MRAAVLMIDKKTLHNLLQEQKECWVSHRTDGLHKHHVFEGRNRRMSEKYGMYVYLRPEWHNMSNHGVHFNKELDVKLKRHAQGKFEEVYGRDEFIKVFGRSYL